MKSYLVGAMALAGACVVAFANNASVANDQTKPVSMRFERHRDASSCGREPCRTWISAVGAVSEKTATEFEAFASSGDLRGATIVLDSEGGSVLSALALGRAIRRLGMTTTIGKTSVISRANGDASRATLSPNADCESMCVFILLGGLRRHVPPEARVLVHQIWLGNKSKRALEANYSANELSLVQRDLARLARYTIEMGGGIELIETAARVPPWEPLYALSRDELRRMRITTVDHPFEPSISTSLLPAENADVQGTATQAQRR